MTCPHPDRPVKARGLCGACYDRWWRTNGGHRNGVHPVVAALEADGGWLTSDGIGLLLPTLSTDAIDRALFRARQRGLVESRKTGSRLDWKAAA